MSWINLNSFIANINYH